MNSLVHQGTAAVHVPGAAPAAVVIVFLRAVPFNCECAEEYFAQSAAVDGFFHRLHTGIEAVLMNHAGFQSGFYTGGFNLFRCLGRDVHRFFNQYMLARFKGFDGEFGVHAAGQTDADNFDVGVLEHLIKIGVSEDITVIFLRFFEFFRD